MVVVAIAVAVVVVVCPLVLHLLDFDIFDPVQRQAFHGKLSKLRRAAGLEALKPEVELIENVGVGTSSGSSGKSLVGAKARPVEVCKLDKLDKLDFDSKGKGAHERNLRC